MRDYFYEQKTAPIAVMHQNALVNTPHLHKEIEIIYVIDGKTSAFADKKCEFLQKGDLFISFPNQIHYYENCQEGDYLVVIFSPDILYAVKDTMINSIPEKNSFTEDEINSVADYLLKCDNDYGKYSDTAISGWLNLTVSSILQKMKLIPRINSGNITLQQIINYCTENFSDNVSLDDISRSLHLSKYHISHLLNEKLGLSLNSYVNLLRINQACELLLNTNLGAAKISEEIGFGSIRSFNRAFFNLMHTNPIQYRNEKTKADCNNMR